MKYTRRQFLHGTTAATAGLLLPSMAEDALASFDETALPNTIETGTSFVTLVHQKILLEFFHDLEIEDWGYFFSLFGPINTPPAPVMTHREAATFLGYEDLSEYAQDNLMVDDSGVPELFNPDAEAELGIYFKKWYYPYDYIEATDYAYCWLRDLDLSLRKKDQPGLEGIVFIDKSAGHRNRSSNYCQRFANAPDKESLLLLQQRLGTLGMGSTIDDSEWRSSWPESQRNRSDCEEFVQMLNAFSGELK